jgi:hypothetical protein
MILCLRKHLVSRCKQRGYTLDEVRPCIVSEGCDSITVDESHPAYPRKRLGLGDYVASALDAVGITKERVEAVVGGPCGCQERQDVMNEVWAKWRRAVRSASRKNTG